MKQPNDEASFWNFDNERKNELPPNFKPIRRQGLSEIVAEHLREAILHGYLAPGQHLPEEQVGQKLGVSRIPVREALSQLEREGLILIRPNRGACVARLSRVDAEEVYSVRLALERLAVQWVVRRASGQAFEEMEVIVREMGRARAGNLPVSEAVELDLRFHNHLYQSSQHARLNAFWSNLHSQVHILILQAHVAHPDFIGGIQQTHADLLAALRTRDEEVAVRALEEHILASYSHIMNSYLAKAADKAQEPMM